MSVRLGIGWFIAAALLMGCSQPEEGDRSEAATGKDHPRYAHPRFSESELDEALGRFGSVWAGEYNNYRSLVQTPGAEPQGSQTHFIYGEVALPSFGDHVIYVQQHYGSGNDPDTVYRQRIYASFADYERSEIVTRIYSFKTEAAAEAAIDAHLDASRLDGLTPDGMNVLPDGCEIFWYPDGEQFIGYQHKGDCIMKAPGGGMDMVLYDDLILNESLFSTFTRGETLEGTRLFGEEVPGIRYRVRHFDCRVESAGAAFRLHDEGGVAELSQDGLSFRLLADDAGGSTLSLFVSDAEGATSRSRGTFPNARFEREGAPAVACALANP